MDDNKRRNSSNEEDDTSPEEEASCVKTTDTSSHSKDDTSPEEEASCVKTTDTSSHSKALTVKDLTRQPIRQRNENKQADSKKQSQLIRQRRENTQSDSTKHCSNLNQNEETEAQISKTGSLVSSYRLIFCLVVILILCGAFCCIYMYWAKHPSLWKKQLDVQKLMSDLKRDFAGQPELTYLVIGAAIKKASSENPESPGIIVLISSKKTKDTADELADRLVQLVSNPHVLIDYRYFSSAQQLKKEIDLNMQANLTKQRMSAVLVRNLDRIPYEAAEIFHGYCDHENAPFKKVVYVMTASVEETIPPTFDGKVWDKLARKHLTAAWKDSGEDQVASLISRLTGNVAAIVTN